MTNVHNIQNSGFLKALKVMHSGAFRMLIYSIVAVGLHAVSAVSADEPKHPDEGHEAKEMKMEMPKSLPALWSAILTHQKELQETLAKKELDDVHHIAFNIRDMVAAMSAKSPMLTAEKKTSLKKASARVASLAKLLDEAGDTGDSTKVATLTGKLNTELKSIEGLYTAKDLKSTQGIAGEEKKMYTCSMHPEVTSDKPGTCPKCGMDLVIKEAEKDSSHHQH